MLYFISSFPFLFAFDVGGPGFEFCAFVAGWRHALRIEWPFIIIIIINVLLISRVNIIIIKRRTGTHPMPHAYQQELLLVGPFGRCHDLTVYMNE